MKFRPAGEFFERWQAMLAEVVLAGWQTWLVGMLVLCGIAGLFAAFVLFVRTLVRDFLAEEFRKFDDKNGPYEWRIASVARREVERLNAAPKSESQT